MRSSVVPLLLSDRLLDILPFPLAVYDYAGTCRYTNKACERTPVPTTILAGLVTNGTACLEPQSALCPEDVRESNSSERWHRIGDLYWLVTGIPHILESVDRLFVVIGFTSKHLPNPGTGSERELASRIADEVVAPIISIVALSDTLAGELSGPQRDLARTIGQSGQVLLQRLRKNMKP